MSSLGGAKLSIFGQNRQKLALGAPSPQTVPPTAKLPMLLFENSARWIVWQWHGGDRFVNELGRGRQNGQIASKSSDDDFLGAHSSQTVPPSSKVPEANVLWLDPGYRLAVVWWPNILIGGAKSSDFRQK